MTESNRHATMQLPPGQDTPMPNSGYSHHRAAGPQEVPTVGAECPPAATYGCTLFLKKSDTKELPSECSQRFANEAEAR